MLAVSWDTIRLFLPPGWINTGTERAGLSAHPHNYRSISRAMTSCWIWLVPS